MKATTWTEIKANITLHEVGYEDATFEQIKGGEWVATSRKKGMPAQALGRTREIAAQQLVKVVTRP